MKNIKPIISIVSFLAAIVIGFIALFVPPMGIIDASVLWFTAQLLVFTSGLLGINMSLDGLKQKAETKIIDKDADNKELHDGGVGIEQYGEDQGD